MSDNTKIEWCDASWPVIRGCTKCSPGCDNCWAIRDAHLHAVSPNRKAASHFAGLTQIQNGRPNWTGEVRLDESILELPLKWRNPRKIFVASSGDLFHDQVTLGMRKRVFAVMRDAPQHEYLILTKRAEEMYEFFRWWIMYHVDALPFNWWPGVSAENDDCARGRVRWLRKIPGGGPHWVSYEPALGPVEWRTLLSRYCSHCGGMHLGQPYENPCSWCEENGQGRIATVGIDWIVIGGESGPRSRPFDLAWARDTIQQCKAAGVPVFMKQMGATPIVSWYREKVTGKLISAGGATWPINVKSRKGSDPSEWPEWARVREWPR